MEIEIKQHEQNGLILMLLTFVASGISASKEKAQFLISSGISTTVGATVFNLTLMWGICLICGTKNMTDKPDFQPEESSPFKRLKGLRGISFFRSHS